MGTVRAWWGVCFRVRRVRQDEAEAVRWHRLAADQSIAEAQYALGVMYGEGRGVRRDEVLA